MSSENKNVFTGRRKEIHTHFFIIFDFIFCDDTVGLLRLLPGELNAALLHFFLDDLTDLGWSCLEKNMSVSEGQTLARTRTRAHKTQSATLLTPPLLRASHECMNIHAMLLNVYMSEISITVHTTDVALP